MFGLGDFDQWFLLALLSVRDLEIYLVVTVNITVVKEHCFTWEIWINFAPGHGTWQKDAGEQLDAKVMSNSRGLS